MHGIGRTFAHMIHSSSTNAQCVICSGTSFLFLFLFASLSNRARTTFVLAQYALKFYQAYVIDCRLINAYAFNSIVNDGVRRVSYIMACCYATTPQGFVYECASMLVYTRNPLFFHSSQNEPFVIYWSSQNRCETVVVSPRCRFFFYFIISTWW